MADTNKGVVHLTSMVLRRSAHGSPPLPGKHPGRLHHLADRIKDPLGPLRGADAVAPGHQHRGWTPSSPSRSPQAIFQAMSRRSELAASRSLKPPAPAAPGRWRPPRLGPMGGPDLDGSDPRTSRAGTAGGGGRQERQTATGRGPGGGTRWPRPAGIAGMACRAHEPGSVAAAGSQREPPDRPDQPDRQQGRNHAQSAGSQALVVSFCHEAGTGSWDSDGAVLRPRGSTELLSQLGEGRPSTRCAGPSSRRYLAPSSAPGRR
jgi:hypothetical protein